MESEFYSAKEQGSVYDFQTDSDAIDEDCEDEAICENESDGPDVGCENESDGPEEASENDSDDQENDQVDKDYEHLQVDEGHDSDEQNDDHKSDDGDDDDDDGDDDENENAKEDDNENDQRNSHRPGRLSSLLREYLKNGGCCSSNCLIK